jgi:hypothetical protein
VAARIANTQRPLTFPRPARLAAPRRSAGGVAAILDKVPQAGGYHRCRRSSALSCSGPGQPTWGHAFALSSEGPKKNL